MSSSTGGTIRILLIEDEVDALNALKDYFDAHGLQVHTATTGEEGLQLLESEEPHIVILDMRLGSGITGMEVLRRAKAMKTQAEIIVVTVVSDINVADLARGLGAAGYLTKPFVIEDLERVVLSRLKDA